MYGIYMLTFTINIPQMLAYIPYMHPMGYDITGIYHSTGKQPSVYKLTFRFDLGWDMNSATAMSSFCPTLR